MEEKPIGGYFEWEFPPMKPLSIHKNAILLNSGRHSLEFILRGLGNVSRLYIPFFTCDVVLQPLSLLNIPYSFYHISEKLEISENIHLEDGEYLLYTNYYGIKDNYVKYLSCVYKNKVIIDNAQALYCPEYADHQFYSPRKFIGMPDGGMVVSKVPDSHNTLPVDKSYDRCLHLLKRLELPPSEGYADFRDNSRKITDSSLSSMSNISKQILASVDFDEIKQKRLNNFKQLHKVLESSNKLGKMITESLSDSFSCPLVYPYLTDDNDLKPNLIRNQVFVATYWPNVFEWAKESDLEFQFAQNVVCIPIDQRYDENDMNRIIELICR